jgi:hypothetical protein
MIEFAKANPGWTFLILWVLCSTIRSIVRAVAK